jgi:hypothetical protein
MRTALARLGFALLRRANASLWWDTADVPGLFDKQWTGRMAFKFATMKMSPPRDSQNLSAPTAARLAQVEDFNFVHVCPGNPGCPPQ